MYRELGLIVFCWYLVLEPDLKDLRMVSEVRGVESSNVSGVVIR